MNNQKVIVEDCHYENNKLKCNAKNTFMNMTSAREYINENLCNEYNALTWNTDGSNAHQIYDYDKKNKIEYAGILNNDNIGHVFCLFY